MLLDSDKYHFNDFFVKNINNIHLLYQLICLDIKYSLTPVTKIQTHNIMINILWLTPG